jgi:C4-dicarboxylate transporter DctM subunit
VILILYGIITEQSIGKLFLAGIIPGIMEAVFYIVTIHVPDFFQPPSWAKSAVRKLAALAP